MARQPDYPNADMIVLAESAPWCSTLRRNFSRERLSWTLNVDDLIDEACQREAIVAIVEFSAGSFAENAEKLHALANNSQNLKLFTIGDDGLLPWRPVLRGIGVAAWYWSFIQVPNLVQAVNQHRNSCPTRELSIEQTVWASLPWPTAANRNQP